MKYIVIMSFAGSVMLLCCLGTCCRKKTLLPFRVQDFLLKGSIFYYLVPLTFVAPLYREVACAFTVSASKSIRGSYQYCYYYGETEGGLQVNTMYYLQVAFFLIWILVALTTLAIRINVYQKKRKQLLAVVKPVTDAAILELFEKIRREQKIKRKIILYDTKSAAFTMGTFSPVICFDSDMTMEQLELMFRHECRHIRRWDVFTRQMVNLVLCVHWFNPLVYLLPKRVERLCEICCDEAVTRGFGSRERAEYARVLLLNINKKQEVPVFGSSLSKNAKVMKERIEIIMNSKKRTKLQMAAAMVLAGMLCFMDSWTVLAYPMPTNVKTGNMEFDPDAGLGFTVGDTVALYETSQYEILYDLLYDIEFIDEEGCIYPGSIVDSDVMVSHTHDWVSGKVQQHIKNDDGGCTVNIYEGQRCSLCGNLIVGDWISTTHYAKCPH